MMKIRVFEEADTEAVVALWHECGLVRAVNDPRKDIARKVREQPELFLVGTLDGRAIASVLAGYDGHRGWLNYVAVATQHQRRGYARAIILEAERLLGGLGCAKINLQVRTSNQAVIEFYRRIGYAIDDVVGMGKRLVDDAK